MQNRLDDIQPYLDKLRSHDVMGFLNYLEYITDKYQLNDKNSPYSFDKHLEYIIIWEFMKTDIKLDDIKLLLNYEILSDIVSNQTLDPNSNMYRVYGNIKKIRRDLLTAFSFKENKDISNLMSEFKNISEKPAPLGDLNKIEEIASNHRNDMSTFMDKLKIKKLGGFYKKVKDKHGQSGIRDKYDEYSRSSAFQKFRHKYAEQFQRNYDSYMTKTRDRRSKASTTRPDHLSMFSSSNDESTSSTHSNVSPNTRKRR